MPGMLGKVLRVDLTTGKTKEELIKQEHLDAYVGGDGLAARILYDEVPPGVGALDPDNRLIFMDGPLTGTHAQGAAAHGITAKSPATGFTAGCAHAMGRFGPMMKFAGYDGIIFEGKSAKPVYLWLHDGQAELKDASKLWGQDTFETENRIREEVGPKAQIDCIGPAGENLSTMAAIVHEKGHVASRCGLGAVMGSKNLKAVAVYGTGKVPVANEELFKTTNKEMRDVHLNFAMTADLAKYGTGQIWEKLYKAGDIPIMNYTKGEIEGWEKLSGQNFINTMKVLPRGCWSCATAHTKTLVIQDGPFAGREVELPEYEVAVAWGSMIGVTDPRVAAVGGDIADRLGFDSLDACNAVAFAMECYEKGLIDKSVTDGLELKWGNYEAVFKLLEKIAKRDGFGNILANGAYRASEHIRKGSDKFVVHSKGMSLPMHDHRSAWGYGMQYAVASAGPVHEGGPLFAEINNVLDRFSTKGKAQAVRAGQVSRIFLNIAGVCSLAMFGVTTDYVCKVIGPAIGREFTTADADKVVTRVVNLRRAFNVRHGLVPADDTLSDRYINQPLAEGGAKGSVINLQPMVREYYDVMGWDHKTGKPYLRTLKALGLDDVARDLWGNA